MQLKKTAFTVFRHVGPGPGLVVRLRGRLAALLLAVLAGCQGSEPWTLMEVGVGVADITPPAGYPHYRGELAGVQTSSTGIKTPLYARALVFRQGHTKGALLLCDLNAIPRDLIRLVRKRASGLTGIPFEHISVAATHTHTAPALRDAAPAYADREAAGQLTQADKNSYLTQLVGGMTLAIVSANQQARQVSLRSGAGQAPGISFNRRLLMTDGRVRFNPGRQNPGIVRPVGPVDPAVHFVMFQAPGQDSIRAALTVFASHTDTEGGTDFSADYPYYLHQQLGQLYGKQLVSVFGVGPCGDINHIDVSKPADAAGKQQDAKRIGLALAKAVQQALPASQQELPQLRIASKVLYLPLQNYTEAELQWARQDTSRLYPGRPFINEMRRRKILSLAQLRQREAIPPTVSGQAWLLPVEIQAFQLDAGTAIVTLPGEVFAELGLELKKRSPFANTLVIELANADIRYVPTRQAFAEGDYEPVNSRLAPGTGEEIVDQAIALLQALARQKS